MTQNIKNFIEEGKGKYIDTLLSILAYQQTITNQGINYNGEKDWALNKILDWHSSHQISLIKMIVEEQEERFSNMLDNLFKGTDEIHTRKHILIGLLRGINKELTDGK